MTGKEYTYIVELHNDDNGQFLARVSVNASSIPDAIRKARKSLAEDKYNPAKRYSATYCWRVQ